MTTRKFKEKAKETGVDGPMVPSTPVDNPPLPCRKCGDLTDRGTLSDYGAMCFGCYQAYCRSGSSAPITDDARKWLAKVRRQRA